MKGSREPLGAATSGEVGPWWAGGLTLAERVRAAGPGGPTGQPEAASAEARRRLQQWRSAYELEATGQFATRLNDVNITVEQLLMLIDQSPTVPMNGRTVWDGPDIPDWARLTERALTAAPAEPLVLATGQPWSEAFGRVLAPFVEVASADLRHKASELSDVADAAEILAMFTRSLRDRLANLASRTLVYELNVARAAGRLIGTTPECRFACFIADIAQRDRLAALLTDYPVLARILANTCLHATAAAVELLTRFATDRREIVARLFHGEDPGRLNGFEAVGDQHRTGRTVAMLRFDSGRRLVYRPRPVSVHAHFNDVVQWLNRLVPGLDLRTLTVLSRSGYGWVEVAEPASCLIAEQVASFYYRQGALLAVLYALGVTDIHHENVIACGDQPVLVDVETLLHPDLPVPGTTPDPAARALRASVYRTALLPQPLIGERGVLDMSGLGGDPDAQHFTDAVDWEAAGTDQMHLVRRPVPFRRADNRPTLNGAPADAVAYSAQLLAGFRAAYGAIAARSGELTGSDGLLRRFATDEVRVIARSTRTYTVLLNESTHPDVLRDALDRDQVFDLLWAASVQDPVRNRLVGREVEQLWDGDVPMFTTRPDCRDLADGSGQWLVDVLDEPGLVLSARKIENMTVIDQRDQEWIIEAALATRFGGRRHECAPPLSIRWGAAAPEPGWLLTAACGIADKIVADAYDDGVFANWLGLEPVSERHSTIMPLGAELANGYLGTALFLAELGQVTGVNRYAEASTRAVRQLPILLAALQAHPQLAGTIGSGAFTGLGGIAYAAARLARLLSGSHLDDCVEAAVRLASIAAAADTNLGVRDGVAGCLAAMLAVTELTGLPVAAETAATCAARLLACPLSAFEQPGFATGAAGVGWALLRFSEHVDDHRYFEAGADLLTQAARGSVPPASAQSWCRGTTGIAAAIADRKELLADPELADFVDRIATGIPSLGLINDHSLCHGELGRQEMLAIAAAHGREAAVAARFEQAGQLLVALDQSGPRCGAAGGVTVPGLLEGLAGIGHGLLRIGFADHVPSALLLHTPSKDRHPGMVSTR